MIGFVESKLIKSLLRRGKGESLSDRRGEKNSEGKGVSGGACGLGKKPASPNYQIRAELCEAVGLERDLVQNCSD